MIPRQAHKPSIHVFVALHAKIGVIGPYDITEIHCPNDTRTTLTSERYISFLEDTLLPEIKLRLKAIGSSLDDCWYQQDGAGPHCSAIALNYLIHKFGMKLISRKTLLIWPPHSPDLTPLDCWFWNALKGRIGSRNPQTVLEVKILAEEMARTFSVFEVCKAIGDFEIRLEALIHCKGRYFERDLASFKTRRLAWKCSHCDGNHCFCPRCERQCDEEASTQEEDSNLSDLVNSRYAEFDYFLPGVEYQPEEDDDDDEFMGFLTEVGRHPQQ